MSGSSSENARIIVRYALISGGSPKTRRRIEPEALSEPPQEAATSASAATSDDSGETDEASHGRALN